MFVLLILLIKVDDGQKSTKKPLTTKKTKPKTSKTTTKTKTKTTTDNDESIVSEMTTVTNAVFNNGTGTVAHFKFI